MAPFGWTVEILSIELFTIEALAVAERLNLVLKIE
jgi:hypothetical protein